MRGEAGDMERERGGRDKYKKRKEETERNAHPTGYMWQRTCSVKDALFGMREVCNQSRSNVLLYGAVLQ